MPAFSTVQGSLQFTNVDFTIDGNLYLLSDNLKKGNDGSQWNFTYIVNGIKHIRVASANLLVSNPRV